MNNLPQQGVVRWIGVRPAIGQPVNVLDQVEAVKGQGLEGDRFKARNTDREITLIQEEHIRAVASMLHRDEISPADLRRNIVVEGINLLALKGKTFHVGGVLLEYTGLAHPCSKMEATLGEGGYNAMRGHGGITARVVDSGRIKVGDPVKTIL
ncbi:MAG TPA: MOSC domain-containing protein [Gammaproteobacteria bacterium]|nr:MOSC domain-containing protein [Gammaproteobacteria bacterium]